MQALRDLIKAPTPKKSKRTEWGDLFDYFFSLGMKDRNGRLLSRGAIGMYLSSFILPDHNYSLLYALKKRCELSDIPVAVFWAYCKPNKK